MRARQPPSELVYEDEHLEVRHLDGASDYTVVSFNEMGTRAGGGRFWGDALLWKNGVRGYGFVSREPNWFPLASAHRASEALVEHDVRGLPRILYGHSMGGFGALKLSRALDATCVLAFCPQATIVPSEMPFEDTRYRSHYRSALHDGMRVGPDDLAGAVAIVYDPRYRLDRLHADLLEEAAVRSGATHRRIRMQHTGHEAVRLLASSEVATAAFELARVGDLRSIGRLLSARRKASSVYLRNLALAVFRSGRPAVAERLIDRAIPLAPDDPRAYHLLSRCHEVQGDLDRAVEVARRGADVSGGKPNMAEHLARLLAARALRDLDAAAALLGPTLRAKLPPGRAHRIFSEVELRRGVLDHALELAEEAHARAPGDEGFRRWLDRVRAISGREPGPSPVSSASRPQARGAWRRVQRWLERRRG